MDTDSPDSSALAKVGKINLSPSTPALDATHLNLLLDRYIESCRERLDNRVTVDGYEDHLAWFKAWWGEHGPGQQWLLRADDLTRFERYLRGAISPRTKENLSYHTRHTALKRLREALKWAHEQGYLDRSYTKWVPTAHGAPPKRKAADIASLQKLLEAVGKGPRPIRDRAIVAMLMGMGVRRAELSSINIEKVVIEADGSGYAHVRGKRTTANPEGTREAAFDAATGKIILVYLDAERRATGPLFIGQRGERLLGAGIYVMLKKAIARAGLSEKIIGPHDLRRAFTTNYRRNRKGKASADLLQRQLGHSSFEQTNEYSLLDIDDIRADIISPMALFSDYARSAIGADAAEGTDAY